MDYEKEEKEFLAELEEGKFRIQRLPNKADDYQKKEEKNFEAFNEYLNSDAFKTLNTEASGK
jgi:hypothetical protein